MIKVTNKGSNETEILLYGDIGESFWGDGVSAKDLINALNGAKDIVTVRINSGGGDAFAGLAMYNALVGSPKSITTQVDGIALSAASVVFMAGKVRKFAENAFLMIHEANSFIAGNAAQMRERADTLEAISDSIAKIYADGTAQSRKQIDAWMEPPAGTWFGIKPENKATLDALDYGFTTEVIENLKIAAKFDPARYGMTEVPQQLKALCMSGDESRRMRLAQMGIRTLAARAPK